VSALNREQKIAIEEGLALTLFPPQLFSAPDEGVRVIRVTGRKDIADTWKVPTLLVDAVLDVDLVRPFWPGVEARGLFKVKAPHQTVCQVTARAYSKGALAADNASGERARRKVAAQILRRVRELGAEGQTLVVGNKAVIDRMSLPADIVGTAHFIALAVWSGLWPLLRLSMPRTFNPFRSRRSRFPSSGRSRRSSGFRPRSGGQDCRRCVGCPERAS